MRNKHLAQANEIVSAKFSGSSPRKHALRAIALAVLMALALCLTACKDSDPGLTKEELRSDPLPDFNDSIFGGDWLIEGKPVRFEVKDHGQYLIPLRTSDKGDSEDKMLFRVKRVGDVLFLEYEFDSGTFRVYRPCRINVDQNALELYCLVSEHLKEHGFTFEVHGEGDDEVKLINADNDRLRDFYVNHAMDQQIFEPMLRYTRPQPARIARLRKKALAGNAEAQEQLAVAYGEGEIVARDDDEAMLWAQKAAHSGRPSAQVLFGDALADKARGTQDTMAQTALKDEARFWYERAAEQKFGRAYFRLGELYARGAETDKSFAVECYRRGMELGDAASQEALGLAYVEGAGVPPDEHLAQTYLEGVPDSDRAEVTWIALAKIYLTAVNTDLRDPKRALVAADNALRSTKSCDTEALFAQAAFENEMYQAAVDHAKRGICPDRQDAPERRATLTYYRNFLPGGPESMPLDAPAQ